MTDIEVRGRGVFSKAPGALRLLLSISGIALAASSAAQAAAPSGFSPGEAAYIRDFEQKSEELSRYQPGTRDYDAHIAEIGSIRTSIYFHHQDIKGWRCVVGFMNASGDVECDTRRTPFQLFYVLPVTSLSHKDRSGMWMSTSMDANSVHYAANSAESGNLLRLYPGDVIEFDGDIQVQREDSFDKAYIEATDIRIVSKGN